MAAGGIEKPAWQRARIHRLKYSSNGPNPAGQIFYLLIFYIGVSKSV